MVGCAERDVGQTHPDEETKTRLDGALTRVRGAAAPLLETLNRQQRAAVSGDQPEAPQA